MKAKSETKPVDVSKGLFMDLAFLLIASLVLLIREPENEEEAQKGKAPPVPTVNVRVASQQAKSVQVDPSLPGQTLMLEIAKDGTLAEVNPADGRRSPMQPDVMADRLKTLQRPRTVVLRADKEVPYERVAQIRETLTALQMKNEIKEIVESVVYEEHSR